MEQKRVGIAGREFVVCGDPNDRYFREFVCDGKSFADAPIAIAQRHCRSDAVLVDAGANIGLSTLAFAQIAPRGHVLAFEPSPHNFALLAANVETNGLKNVDLVQVALSDREGVLRLVEDAEFMAGSRIESTTSDGQSNDCIEVRSTTLDIELSRRNLRRLDLLKIDVEGHEHQVIDGAAWTLATFRPMCVVEFNSYVLVYHQGASPRGFLDYLLNRFPNLYYFEKTSGALRNLRGQEDAFLKLNSETGFVDDLVGTFEELPGV
jgi:FkbM family methyltransferase